MVWPDVELERLAPSDFRPGFCPWPDCRAHRHGGRPGSAFARHGSYRRLGDGRRVPRFRCRLCRRTFSLQTFAFSYYLKRPELTLPIARGLVAGSAHRQIARSVGCHHASVTRRAQRLGRHAALLHHLVLRALPEAAGREPVVVDDFDSFAYSQYFPCTLPTAVGARSWFVYGFAFARERRRGPRGSPRTRAARARDRAMFPNDQLHRFLRHSEAAHRRETIAFGRSYNALLERLALFVVWRNLVQSRSERRPGDGTTAIRQGVTDRRWSWERVFARRLQPSLVDPPGEVWRLYRRLIVTPPLRNEKRHTLSRAF